MDPTLAQELVQAARRDDREAIKVAVGRLFPDIQRYVQQLRHRDFARLAAKVRLDENDITSFVVGRMLARPPIGTEERTPSASVLGWIKVTAYHHLISEQRRLPRGAPRDGDGTGDDQVDETSQHAISAERRLEATRRVAAHRRMLAACYPDGLALYDLTAERDGENEAVLASDLGISRDGLQQRRRRMRLHCSVLEALDQKPRQTDAELARTTDSAVTADTQRIFKKLRHYLVARAQGRL